MNDAIRKITTTKGYLAVLFVVVVVLGIYYLHSILMPFLVAAFLAYLLDPLADVVEARGRSRTFSVCLVFVVLSLVFTVFSMLLVPLLFKQLSSFINQLPEYLQWCQKSIAVFSDRYFNVAIEEIELSQLKKTIRNHWQEAGGVAGQVVKHISSSTMNFMMAIANIVLIPVVTFYLLRDWDRLIKAVHHYTPKAWNGVVKQLAQESDEVLSAFIRGQLLVMLALGILYSVGLSIIGLELALFLGMLAGLASVVPYLGAFVGIFSASIAAYMQFQDVMPVCYVLVVFGVGQAIEGMLLTPLLVGDKIGLHPVAVIFAIMAGGQLAGFYRYFNCIATSRCVDGIDTFFSA